MNQTIFVDPSSTVPAAGGGNTGNGTMSTPVPSSATLTENFTITCTVPGGAGVGQFSVTGSVSGLLGTATSNVEFVDADQKVRFTITAGATPWAVSDAWTFSTVAGTPLNQANFDAFVTGIQTIGAKVYNPVSTVVPDNTWTAIGFNQEAFDTDTIHSNVTNPSRLTCKTPGKYMVSAAVIFPGDGIAAMVAFEVKKNGASLTPHFEDYRETTHIISAGNVITLSGSQVVDLALNDYIELFVWQDNAGGSNKNVHSEATMIEMVRIGL